MLKLMQTGYAKLCGNLDLSHPVLPHALLQFFYCFAVSAFASRLYDLLAVRAASTPRR
jgi:hypothetical protein